MKYKVPVSWQMYGYVTVEADTLNTQQKSLNQTWDWLA